MKRKTDPSIIKRRKRPGLTDQQEENAARERADERLDEALRQTFPASDALSITRRSRSD
jgi:hypothetical protein